LRERATIDLRGLGPALKAHARARNLTVSDVARLAVVELLKASGDETCSVESPSMADGERPVKLTLRLRRDLAMQLSTRARTAGLSQSSYVATLIDGAPAPPLALARELGDSTDQLATVAADLNEVVRAVGRSATPSALLVKEWLRTPLEDVRRHLAVASRLVSELRPARAQSAREVREVGPARATRR
jgi:hypothetical protein